MPKIEHDHLATVSLEVDDDRAVADKVDLALRRLGFFVVTDHGVPTPLIDRALVAAKAFFAQTEAEKRAAATEADGSPRGYTPFAAENLSATLGKRRPQDLREGFGMGPPRVRQERGAPMGGASYRPNRWPTAPAGFEAAITDYFAAMERLTARLMRVFAAALDLAPDYFEQRFQDHNSTLRLSHYPPPQTKPEPGQFRAGAHTDYGALTILLGEQTPGGLEVRTPAGVWLPAQTGPHDFVINIGDLMMTWSNDRWLSNVHRVANPSSEDAATSARMSLAYFCNPDDALEIVCLPSCIGPDHPPRYAPTTAGEHRMAKIARSLTAMDGNATT